MDGSYLPPKNMGMDVGSNLFATQKPYHDINLPSQRFPATNPVLPAHPAFCLSKPPHSLPNQDHVVNRLLTRAQQQPRVYIVLKDSIDAGRGRKKKRYRHYSRSPSEELHDSALTPSRVGDRSRSPPPQKMPICTGNGELTWESFIYRFQRTSTRRCCDEA